MKSGKTSTVVTQDGIEYDVVFRFRVDADLVEFFDIEVDGRQFDVEDADDAWLEQMRSAALERAAQICW